MAVYFGETGGIVNVGDLTPPTTDSLVSLVRVV